VISVASYLATQGMWMMLQAETPEDFVLATGETHPVREFVEKAFRLVDIEVEWVGEPGTVDEVGVDKNNPDHVLVKVDPQYFRYRNSCVSASSP
jgi:GDPmannose 4,6-dehydratase